jgi:CDP-diacylglycerol pyrophosphatase
VRTLLAAAVMLVLAAASGGADTARALAVDPNALWKIVHDNCVPNQMQHANPAPCALVDLDGGPDKGYAILKDLQGATQYLLIPTARVSGIESPELLAPDAPNYFAAAWKARSFVDAAARRTLPRDDLSLAINSVHARTQDQLHIHIDCVRVSVREALHRHLGSIGDAWAPFVARLRGHHYRAIRVFGDGLDGFDPFKSLADGVPGAKSAMGEQTLVVIGADFPGGRPGFVILNDHVDPAARDNAGGEELQDHTCAAAQL